MHSLILSQDSPRRHRRFSSLLGGIAGRLAVLRAGHGTFCRREWEAKRWIRPIRGKDKVRRPGSCLGAVQVPPPLVRRRGAVAGLARERCQSGPGGAWEPPARRGLAGPEPAAGAAGAEAAVEDQWGSTVRPACVC